MLNGPGTVVVKHSSNAGVVAGLLGCVFGILGIFTFGLIFVPLAAICCLVGLIRGAGGLSVSGIGCSLLAGALAVWGFIVSPTLWVMVGAGILAQQTQTAAPQTSVATAIIEPAIPRISVPPESPTITQANQGLGTVTHDHFPVMSAAENSLRVALEQLRQTRPVFGGHDTQAVQLVKQAIDELEAGKEFATQHGD